MKFRLEVLGLSSLGSRALGFVWGLGAMGVGLRAEGPAAVS